jgi:hypothetical protein
MSAGPRPGLVLLLQQDRHREMRGRAAMAVTPSTLNQKVQHQHSSEEKSIRGLCGFHSLCQEL